MSHYGYQYKQQWYIPSGTTCATPSFSTCPKPCVVTCASGSTKGAELCAAQSSTSCMETRVVQDRSARSTLPTLTCSTRCPIPCGTRCPVPCGPQCPQLHLQGWEQLAGPQCTGGCATACTGQHCSYPYSYQWSKSYSYGSGPC